MIQSILDAPRCFDKGDQVFIDLAVSGRAEILITGDKALLKTKVEFKIINPAEYKAFIALSE